MNDVLYLRKILKSEIFYDKYRDIYRVFGQVISTQTRFQEIVLVTSNEEYIMS